ncbi:hypothetical protein [Pedobacter kyonggii]|nr:hypothetical protein [Pedobacter kyonggii]
MKTINISNVCAELAMLLDKTLKECGVQMAIEKVTGKVVPFPDEILNK